MGAQVQDGLFPIGEILGERTRTYELVLDHGRARVVPVEASAGRQEAAHGSACGTG